MYLVLSDFYSWLLSFLRSALSELAEAFSASRDFLAKFSGRRKDEQGRKWAKRIWVEVHRDRRIGIYPT